MSNGEYESVETLEQAESVVRDWTPGNVNQRLIRLRSQWGEPDCIAQIGSTSNNGAMGGYTVWFIRRGDSRWIAQYLGGSAASNAGYAWVNAYARPWNGGLGYAEARRAARLARGERR